MLNKKLCIKCLKNANEWNNYIKRASKKGWIFCPPIYLGGRGSNLRKLTDQPPIDCPYYLEYTI